jgi:hypothetical protein
MLFILSLGFAVACSTPYLCQGRREARLAFKLHLYFLRGYREYTEKKNQFYLAHLNRIAVEERRISILPIIAFFFEIR